MAETQIKTHKNYIGGQWVESVTGRTYQVHNPAHTDQIIGEFQTSGADDALRAVAAAKEGLAV
ncbi:MAG: aldehyde dehydrogenase family protein, partial [Chloroflexi bacterium]|nr:aldehyde dehydrogenase family protein [Chloroflexota bacterium]